MQPGPASTSPSGAGSTASGSTSAMPPGQAIWIEREARPVRALAVELGVERVAAARRRARGRSRQVRRGCRSSGVPRPTACPAAPRWHDDTATYCSAVADVGERLERLRRTSAWSSARWRTMTSVQPSAPSAANASATRLGPPDHRRRRVEASVPAVEDRPGDAVGVGVGRRRRARPGAPRSRDASRPCRAHASR